MIKKYKRTLVNFQEDFLIPFINKASWRYMQFSPERYPSLDVKFLPTATLGIIAREYEQKQLAFMIQTLGAQSPITPILMNGILKNSSLSNREEMLEQLAKQSAPNPEQEQAAQAAAMADGMLKQAQAAELNAKAKLHEADTAKTAVEAELAPKETEARIMNAISTNLPNDDAAATMEFDRRVKIADLMIKEEGIKSKKDIVKMQMEDKKGVKQADTSYLDQLEASLRNPPEQQ
jgi:hypothetical protein